MGRGTDRRRLQPAIHTTVRGSIVIQGLRVEAHGPMDARGSTVGQPMLARARDRSKSTRRRTGCDGDRIDARYRIADDRGPQGRGADVREPRARFAPPIRRVGGRGR